MKRNGHTNGVLATLIAGLALLMVLPAGVWAHAVVSPSQPQTTPLTAARTSYVLRVPNEKETQATYKVVLLVPQAVQEAISVKQVSDWKVRLSRKNTGRVNEGSKVYATSRITWIAKKGSKIKPGFFGEFYFRFQNPIQPQKFCFPVLQYYNGKKKRGKPEIVRWTGPPTAEFPASCVTTAAAPPAAG
jgi:uncharacterized protein YcnI